MSAFSLYLIGSILVAAGFAFAAYKLGLSTSWIIIIAIIIIGFGIRGGVKKNKGKINSPYFFSYLDYIF